MGRAPRFENSHFISAAQAILAQEGQRALTIQKIAARAGATTGSVYHRFESLDLIAAEAWLDAAEDFQREFRLGLQGANLFERVVAGALHTPRWSREHIVRARLLSRFDTSRIEQAELPESIRGRVHSLSRDLRKTTMHILKEYPDGDRKHRMDLLRFLLIDMPLAAVKPHLTAGRKPPAYVDAFIQKSIHGFKGELS